MNSLLSVLTKITSYPHQLHSTNVWFFINSYIYYFKLLNQLTFFTYVTDALKINTIKLYYKQFNGLALVFVFIKIVLVVTAIVLF